MCAHNLCVIGVPQAQCSWWGVQTAAAAVVEISTDSQFHLSISFSSLFIFHILYRVESRGSRARAAHMYSLLTTHTRCSVAENLGQHDDYSMDSSIAACFIESQVVILKKLETNLSQYLEIKKNVCISHSLSSLHAMPTHTIHIFLFAQQVYSSLLLGIRNFNILRRRVISWLANTQRAPVGVRI